MGSLLERKIYDCLPPKIFQLSLFSKKSNISKHLCFHFIYRIFPKYRPVLILLKFDLTGVALSLTFELVVGPMAFFPSRVEFTTNQVASKLLTFIVLIFLTDQNSTSDGYRWPSNGPKFLLIKFPVSNYYNKKPI